MRRLLARDPGLARARGGPFGWRPLCYLAYSRLDGVPSRTCWPSRGSCWRPAPIPDEGLPVERPPYTFTALTGVLGGGEQGPVRQPRHPHWRALARLLLDAGADPNDGQALYNNMFSPANDHLELLFEYGLGRPHAGAWQARARRPGRPPPASCCGSSCAGRSSTTSGSGCGCWPSTASTSARRTWATGRRGLRATGGRRSSWRCCAATARSRTTSSRRARRRPSRTRSPTWSRRRSGPTGPRWTASSPGTPAPSAQARRARPGLMVWAAAQAPAGTVELLAELGFDVNALGRADAPVEQEWETALHHSAGEGKVELTRRLLALGADPHDPRPAVRRHPAGLGQAPAPAGHRRAAGTTHESLGCVP